MTGTKAPLKIIPTHRTTSSGKMNGALPNDTQVSPKPKLLDQLREALRSRHYSHCAGRIYQAGNMPYIQAFFCNTPTPPEPWTDRSAPSCRRSLTDSGVFYTDPYKTPK